jgi:hypothetical protein
MCVYVVVVDASGSRELVARERAKLTRDKTTLTWRRKKERETIDKANDATWDSIKESRPPQ